MVIVDVFLLVVIIVTSGRLGFELNTAPPPDSVLSAWIVWCGSAVAIVCRYFGVFA